ncbi:5-histidylcysteine sulfoxide synthase [Marinicella rhabdoformis]|uniref:5-histidylcysteine sulfoxide synthase n=1 Tax=Marinicella rhabdoformis TaxID=2580566 RepID=UPI0012AED1F3|nr:5-histidylcysteine sulfoxide synthase [Marinicella rhabdoformis]
MQKHTHTPHIDVCDATSLRNQIKSHFLMGFEKFESLHQTLTSDKAYYQQPEPLRHPIIFYLGHTAVFFANKLKVAKIINHSIDDAIESMMAIGVDEMSWDDLNQTNYQWPQVSAVYQYRQKVKTLVSELIDSLPLTTPITWNDPFWIILMGIEHERIHLETSSVLFRQLDTKFLKASENWPTAFGKDESTALKNQLLHVDATTVTQTKSNKTYGWDNEYGQLTTEVNAFKASQFLVSNAEFLEFVDDGGYQDTQWWCEEGASWLAYTQAQHPHFWRRVGKQWQYRSLLSWHDMIWQLPVDVNYLEAKAFCHWLAAKTGKPIRLPSEAEWYALAQFVGININESPQAKTANLHLAHGASAVAVNRFLFGEQQFGDVVGNVWQWCETAIDALPGFKVHPAYDDFSVPTFDGRHNLIKGGSWASTGNEALPESRYAFRRHFFQHAGFRYVESEQTITQHFNTYETDELISQYLEFHYGEEYFGVANFPKACIDTIIKHSNKQSFNRVLDLGCAVGRSSFELAHYAQHVDAVDFSTRFIRNAINLIKHQEIKYMIPIEGDITEAKQIQLSQLNLGDKVHNIEFTQGDACNLKDKYRNYDLVFAGNLIDRLYQPASFIHDIKTRINPAGYLAITSPYTWLEEFTNKENWLGGYKKNGENVQTLDHLKALLSPEFELVHHQDIPFVIRETARKHQHTLAQFSLWKKTSKT